MCLYPLSFLLNLVEATKKALQQDRERDVPWATTWFSLFSESKRRSKRKEYCNLSMLTNTVKFWVLLYVFLFVRIRLLQLCWLWSCVCSPFSLIAACVWVFFLVQRIPKMLKDFQIVEIRHRSIVTSRTHRQTSQSYVRRTYVSVKTNLTCRLSLRANTTLY